MVRAESLQVREAGQRAFIDGGPGRSCCALAPNWQAPLWRPHLLRRLALQLHHEWAPPQRLIARHRQRLHFPRLRRLRHLRVLGRVTGLCAEIDQEWDSSAGSLHTRPPAVPARQGERWAPQVPNPPTLRAPPKPGTLQTHTRGKSTHQPRSVQGAGPKESRHSARSRVPATGGLAMPRGSVRWHELLHGASSTVA